MYLKIATSSKDNINIRNSSESAWTINITERPVFKLLKRWINLFSMRDIAKQDNLLLAYNRLLTNPESTYKNFFRDTYSAYGMAISKNIALLHKEVKSGYLPVDTVRVFMPKANGLSRMYTLMSIEDQIVYQAYANVLAEALVTNPKVRRRYKKSVFGNLYSNADSLFFYQKWQDSYKAYTKAIIKAYESGNKYIASFDLTAC